MMIPTILDPQLQLILKLRQALYQVTKDPNYSQLFVETRHVVNATIYNFVEKQNV